MIKVKNLKVSRGDRVVIDDLTHSFETGECHWIVGENGVGKSTLLSTISGDLPYSGQVLIDNHELQEISLSKLRSLRAVLTQDLEIDFPISVRDALKLVTTDNDAIDDIASKLALHDLLDKTLTKLSKGQLQRTLIAQAILQKASHLLLDEPFSAQDAGQVDRLTSILKKLTSEGITVILVSHMNIESTGLVDKKLAL